MLKLHALTERNEGGEESKDKKDSPSRIHESGRQRIARALQSADANCKGSEDHQTNGRVAASEGAPAWYSVRSSTLARLSNGSGRVIPGLHSTNTGCGVIRIVDPNGSVHAQPGKHYYRGLLSIDARSR